MSAMPATTDTWQRDEEQRDPHLIAPISVGVIASPIRNLTAVHLLLNDMLHLELYTYVDKVWTSEPCIYLRTFQGRKRLNDALKAGCIDHLGLGNAGGDINLRTNIMARFAGSVSNDDGEQVLFADQALRFVRRWSSIAPCIFASVSYGQRWPTWQGDGFEGVLGGGIVWGNYLGMEACRRLGGRERVLQSPGISRRATY